MPLVSGINGSLLSQLFSAFAATDAHILTAEAQVPLLQAPPAKASEVIQPREVIVLRGHDHIERVLEKFKVPYKSIQSNSQYGQLTEPLLAGAGFLFANCGGELHGRDPFRIAEWVKSGGRLLTSDWMVYHLLEKGFRDEDGKPLVQNLRRLGANISTNESVEAYISSAAWEDPAARIFLKDGEKISWRVRKCSFPITVLSPEKVEVLARSDEGVIEPETDVLLLRFAYGRGQVIHLLSHWEDQEFEGEVLSEKPGLPRSSTFIREK